MSTIVEQHQQTAFSTPAYRAPQSSSVVRGNFNTLATTLNAHDADPGIHFQSSALASRPAAGVAGRKWFTSDGFRLYHDNGVTWDEAAYLGLAAGGTVAGATTFSAAVTMSSTLAVTGAITGTLGTAAQPNITSIGTLTALALNGDLTFSGADRKITPGTTSFTLRNIGDTADMIAYTATALNIGTSAVNITFPAATNVGAADPTVGFLKLPFADELPANAGAPSGSVCLFGSSLYIAFGGTWKSVALA